MCDSTSGHCVYEIAFQSCYSILCARPNPLALASCSDSAARLATPVFLSWMSVTRAFCLSMCEGLCQAADGSHCYLMTRSSGRPACLVHVRQTGMHALAQDRLFFSPICAFARPRSPLKSSRGACQGVRSAPDMRADVACHWPCTARPGALPSFKIGLQGRRYL